MDLSNLMPSPYVPWVGLVVGVVALVVTTLWVHHLAQGEGEYRSFRATRHGESRLTMVAVGLTIGALAALLVMPVIAGAMRL